MKIVLPRSRRGGSPGLEALGLLLSGGLALSSADGAESGQEFFEASIRPLLIENCQKCHGETKQEGGLRLDTRAGWEKGGDKGTVIVPGDPGASLLIQAVRRLDKDLQM
ncbi:MAG TPA: hypothetical protein P5016_14590, partial [Verrucomicrobiales bacterium]|nr:hypothetical protein [Verrucomicrobiales bacterium]